MQDRTITDLLRATTTSAVSDVLMRRGIRTFMQQRIAGLGTLRVWGPALTVERVDRNRADPASVRPNVDFLKAIETAPTGTVLVFNGEGEPEAALWGGLMAAVAVRQKLGGVVADGPVRDPGEIVELGCPCFCTGSVSAGQAGILALTGIGNPLVCGGVTVNSGDYVFGDVSGVVVIPKGLELEVLQQAVELEAADQKALTLLKDGMSLGEVMKALGRG